MPFYKITLTDPFSHHWTVVWTENTTEEKAIKLAARQNRLLSEEHQRKPYVITKIEVCE